MFGTAAILRLSHNNYQQGLDVQFELVAIVDTTNTGAESHSLTLLNSTSQDVPYQFSHDNVNSENSLLRTTYQKNFELEKPEVYVKLQTLGQPPLQYKLTPENWYKIIYNLGLKRYEVRYY